ncbi:MAG TPA: BlaI/MecI/CopY family transcriptional regulator [bacterium]|nr:BlaI/MecI/CopY family transcriptional regulator [bacterium]HQO36202.1 BlaI/MecI/CopY family transcriptional regulator [bacterium]HQP97290.1 BlaI/MecI/CopY family transcriptional regulator [bacterium]
MRKQTPSVSEMEILDILCRLGTATVQDIRKALPKHRKLAHTTIITNLQRLEDKGLVAHEKSERGKAFVFSPTRPMEKVKRHLVSDFLNDYFGNDPIPLVSSLIQTKQITKKELEQLREILDAAEKNSNGGP